MNKIYSFLLPLMLLAVALTGATPANAASVYDNHFQTTDKLEILMPNFTPCQNVDITSNWSEYITDNTKWLNPDHSEYVATKLSFESALANGSWGVSQINQPEWSNNTQKHIQIYWVESGQLTLDWYQNYGTMVDDAGLKTGYVHCENSQEPKFNLSTDAYSVVTRSHGGTRNLFITNVNPNYPTDYEGPQVPEGGSTPAEPINEKPYIKMDTLTQWKASFSDQNFYSIDNPPFLCTDGFPPRITLEIWNKSDTTVDGGLMLTETVSANSKLDYTFPTKTHDVNYEIVGWYSCTDGTPFVDPNASFYPFTIDRTGSLAITPNLESCVTETYPFVHFDGCMANMSIVADALSFGTVDVGASDGQWTFTDGCHQLGTIGDWMNMDNRSVCPAIPSYVRNVVTPFITFALGMMTLRFITRQGGNSL